MGKTVKTEQLESMQVYPVFEVEICDGCGKKHCQCEEVEYGDD